jgi:hypothetical protein
MANIFVLPGEGLRIFPGAATSACSEPEHVDAAVRSGTVTVVSPQANCLVNVVVLMGVTGSFG